MTKNTMNV